MFEEAIPGNELKVEDSRIEVTVTVCLVTVLHQKMEKFWYGYFLLLMVQDECLHL